MAACPEKPARFLYILKEIQNSGTYRERLLKNDFFQMPTKGRHIPGPPRRSATAGIIDVSGLEVQYLLFYHSRFHFPP